MLAACARRKSRQLGPERCAPAPAPPERAADGCSSERRRSRAWLAHHRSAGGPSADSPARAATPTREPQPAASAVHAGRPPAATSGERVLDASAAESAGSPEADAATSAADGRLRLPTGPDRARGASAGRPAGAGSRARGAAPALDVFHLQAAAATNKRAKQSPHGEVEEREGHAADPPSPHAKERRHQFWRPSRFLVLARASKE
jgi:hypothetical protein